MKTNQRLSSFSDEDILKEVEYRRLTSPETFPIEKVYGLMIIKQDEPHHSTVDNYTTFNEAYAKMMEWYETDKNNPHMKNVKLHDDAWYEYTISDKKHVVCINKSHVWVKH